MPKDEKSELDNEIQGMEKVLIIRATRYSHQH